MEEGFMYDAYCQFTYPHSCVVKVATGFEGFFLGVITCQSDGTWTAVDSTQTQELLEYLNDEILWVSFLDQDFVDDAIEDIVDDPLDPDQMEEIFHTIDEDGDGQLFELEISAVQVPIDPTRVECASLEQDAFEGYIVDAGDSLFEDTRVISCDEGYEGEPSPITCTADGVWEELSGCEVTCGDPVSATGYVIGDGATTAESIRTVTCAEGHQGEPSPITCTADGVWEELSGCEVWDCGTEVPEEYATGYIVETEGSTLLDSVRTVTCDTAAGFDGNPAAIICSTDGWTPVDDGGSYSFCTFEGSQEVPISSVAETFSFQSSAPVAWRMPSLLIMLVVQFL
jgi:hypothetical protein